jgi:hypothetical protein
VRIFSLLTLSSICFFVSGCGNEKVEEDLQGEYSTELCVIIEYWFNDPELAKYPDYFIRDYDKLYQDISLL